jgi:hypothetical protein
MAATLVKMLEEILEEYDEGETDYYDKTVSGSRHKNTLQGLFYCSDGEDQKFSISIFVRRRALRKISHLFFLKR